MTKTADDRAHRPTEYSGQRRVTSEDEGQCATAGRGRRVHLAVEHARHAIRATSLVIGWTESEMTAPSFALKKFADNVIPRIPMRRWGQPSDLGGIAVYLTSDASSWHTGDIITLDGGYSIF